VQAKECDHTTLCISETLSQVMQIKRVKLTLTDDGQDNIPCTPSVNQRQTSATSVTSSLNCCTFLD